MQPAAHSATLHDGRRPRAREGGRVRPVEAEHRVEGAAGRRQPVALQVRTGRPCADVDDDRAVLLLLEAAEHGAVEEVAFQGVVHQKLRLAVVHRQRPERLGHAHVPGSEPQLVRALGRVEGLAAVQLLVDRVHRLLPRVAVQADLRPGEARFAKADGSPVAAQELPRAEEVAGGDLAGRHHVRDRIELLPGVRDALLQGLLQGRVQRVGLEGAAADAQLAEAVPRGLLAGVHGHGQLRQEEVDDLEDLRRPVALHAERLRPRCRGSGRRRGCAAKAAQGLQLVLGLHGLHVLEVLRTEELRPSDEERERRLAPEDRGARVRRIALPVRSHKEVAASAVARGPGSQVAVVEGVHVDHLERPVPPGVYRRHSEHHGLRPQVQPHHGVRRVRVGRHDGRVRGREYLRQVCQAVEGRLVLRAALVHHVAEERVVVLGHRPTVHVDLLGDGARLVR
mmetsp:Transcript_41301/g.128358  ORF Transcript_41301/g.128358 Transcript_41301/m.128358 type:complete len:452 (-) Transcript_41301:82-1437(-)